MMIIVPVIKQPDVHTTSVKEMQTGKSSHVVPRNEFGKANYTTRTVIFIAAGASVGVAKGSTVDPSR